MTAAQVTHAAGESSDGKIPKGTIAVVLGIEKEKLEKISNLLKQANIEFVKIIEDDEPFNGQLMALGLKPQLKINVYKHLKHLKLLS